jgi:hypothetical protein
MSFARAGRLCLQASSRNSALLRRVEEGSNVCSTNSLQQMRRMSGKHPSPHLPIVLRVLIERSFVYLSNALNVSGGNHGPGVTYEGLTLHPPATWHKVVAEGMTGMMW